MDNSEIQKLISIFLGLAIIISSGTFVFLDLFPSANETSFQNSTNQNSSDSNNSKGDFEGKTAFVESPKSLPSYYATISLQDEFQPSGNLTDDYASYAAREIVKANPNGPQIDESGNQNINVPNIDKLSTEFTDNVISKVNLPNTKDWDNEVENIISKTKFTEEISTNTIISYFKNFADINQKNFKFDNLTKNLDSNYSDPEIIINSQEQSIYNVINEFKNVEVPKIALDFHKSFIKFLIYQKNLLQISHKLNNDPIYIAYFTNNIESDYNKVIEDFNNKYNELLKKKISILKTQNNLFSSFFSINKAQAFFLPDFVIEVGPLLHLTSILVANSVQQTIISHLSFARRMLEWFKKLLTEILKDKLIHRLVNQVIRWAQGGGKPQFITNWKGFLGNAFSQGVGDALQQIYPRICQPFRPLLQIAFQNQQTDEKNVYCTLDRIVNNLKDFYDDFKYGNWIAYASVVHPNGNFFGQFILAKDIALKKGLEEQESQKNDAQASKGFLSAKVCVSYKVLSSIPKSEKSSTKIPQGAELKCGPINQPGFAVAKDACAIVECQEYENTTPGGIVADIVGQSIPLGPIGRIVNAQDITALITALVDAALNKLIQAGQKGLSRLFSGDQNTENKGLPTGAVSNPEDACYGTIPGTEEYNDCQKINNNNLYQTNSKEDQASILQQARNVLDQLKQSLKADQDFLDAAPDVQSKLQTIGGCSNTTSTATSTSTTSTSTPTPNLALCPNLASNACELNSQIEKTKPLITEEMNSINSDIKKVSNIIIELDSSQVALERLKEIQSDISTYNDTALNKPKERLNSLQQIKDAAEKNINSSPQCSVELPSF